MLKNAFRGRQLSNYELSPLIRYDQVVHLVSAANGAEEHYTRWSKLGCKASHIFNLFRSNNKSRTEDIDLAKTNDRLVGEAWVGHPYYELIDNSTDFETKMRRLCRYYIATYFFLMWATYKILMLLYKSAGMRQDKCYSIFTLQYE